MARTEELIVMESFHQPSSTTNPYISMLLASLRATPGLEVHVFSWRRALIGRLDVFHAHWPEILVSANTRAGRLVRQVLFALFLLRLSVTRVPVVRTQHNLNRPHGIPRIQSLLLDGLERRTVHSIVLNESTPIPDGQGRTVIPHGHYREWFSRCTQPDAVAGQIGYFGLIRRYKGVETLIKAFRDLPGDRTLVVAGNPSTPELAAELRDSADGDQRISFKLQFLADEELVRVVRTSNLVVLPYPEMHNSGAVLAALSLDRPVLVPRNAVNDALAEEVGPSWVIRYDGPMTGAILAAAMTGLPDKASGRPDLSRREWSACGAAHLDAFRAARRER